jgi:hypothetical protein
MESADNLQASTCKNKLLYYGIKLSFSISVQCTLRCRDEKEREVSEEKQRKRLGRILQSCD